MGKLVVTEFVTLDGVMQDPGGAEKDTFARGGWAFRYDRGDGERWKYDELMAADVQLLGRRTYDGFAKAWPTMEGTGEFGEKMNSMEKVVFSSTLESPTWSNTTVISGDLTEQVEALKDRVERDILVAGSAQLVHGLVAAGLVDELHLMVFPVVLGEGKRVFGESAEMPFTLVESRPTGQVTLLTLRRE